MTNKKHHDLLFGVCRSIRYHSRRQAFYESIDRWTNLLLLLLGSGAIALALENRPAWILSVGFSVSVISGLKLVYAFGSKAGKHGQFVKDFTRLEKQLRTETSEEIITAVTQERLNLEASEPPVMRVLDVLCHNELIRAMGYDNEEEWVRVPWWQRLTANLFNYGEHRLEKGG